jgi:hypothetical protein
MTIYTQCMIEEISYLFSITMLSNKVTVQKTP